MYQIPNDPVLKYLKDERRLSDDTIATFSLGSFPVGDDFDDLVNYIGYEVAREINILGYDDSGKVNKFKHNNVVVPIFDAYGSPIAIIGRTLLSEDKRKELGVGKYINTPFKKSMNLFGLNINKQSIRNKGTIHVVEGNFDVITAYQHNIKNVAAASWANLTKGQLVIASRYAKNINLMFDNDEAGINGAEKVIERYSNISDLTIYSKKIPSKYKDLDEYCKLKLSS